MDRLLALVLGASLVAAGPQGQQPPFRSGVSLVTVDVTVLDAEGQPVPGLTAADFEVKLNGRVQAVRSATYLQAAAMNEMSGAVGPAFDAVAPAAPLPADKGTASQSAPRAFVVLVDDLSFLPTRGRGLFAAARQFVAALPASDRVGFATTTGLRVVNPTVDRAPVRDALMTVVGAYADPKGTAVTGPDGGKFAAPDQSVGVAQSIAIERGDAGALEEAIVRECFNGDRTKLNGTSIAQLLAEDRCAATVQSQARRTAAFMRQQVERQLHAYTSVIRAMQPFPGLKHIVLLTDGVGLYDVTTLAPVARAAAEAGVQISVIMETADASMTDQGRRASATGQAQQTDIGAPQRRREDDALVLNGARTVADNVGAMFHLVTGSPEPFFGRVARAASAVYRLGVEAPPAAGADKDFSLTARVKRGGYTVVANRRAVAGTASATPAAAAPTAAARVPMSVDDRLRSAIATGRSDNAFSVAAGTMVRRADDPSQVTVDIAIDVAGSATAPLNAVLGLVDERGAIKTARKQIEAAVNGSYKLDVSMPLPAGRYKLRVAAADASGAIGSTESTLDARLTTLGGLTTSGLLRYTTDASGAQRPLLQDTIATDAATLVVALEIYSAASGDPVVKIALKPADGGDEIERVISPETRDGALVAEAEFALERLKPGSYELRATVLSGTSELGSIASTVKR